MLLSAPLYIVDGHSFAVSKECELFAKNNCFKWDNWYKKNFVDRDIDYHDWYISDDDDEPHIDEQLGIAVIKKTPEELENTLHVLSKNHSARMKNTNLHNLADAIKQYPELIDNDNDWNPQNEGDSLESTY